MYLSKTFLSVVFEVFGVDVEVVVIDGKRLGALCNAGHKLLHLQNSTARPVDFKVPHWNVGGSDAICRIRKCEQLGEMHDEDRQEVYGKYLEEPTGYVRGHVVNNYIEVA